MKPTLLRKKSEQLYRLFVTCPNGLEAALKMEILTMGFTILKEFPAGIEIEGPLETAYRATLGLRVASKVLLLISEANGIDNPEQLYDFVRTISWHDVFAHHCTFALHATETTTKFGAKRMPSHLVALKTKDAIVDHFRDRFKERPNVDREDPDIPLMVHLHNRTLKIYLDLAGRGLHERGYRVDAVEAPIRENIAAGLLYLAGWVPGNTSECFLDPFCGSGTFPIEAAMIATRTAPGLLRSRFGFLSWRQHSSSIFEKVREQMLSERVLDVEKIPPILGHDVDGRSIQIAKSNAEQAGMTQWIQFKQISFEDSVAPFPKGLIVCNPPYGVRLKDEESAILVYQKIGSTLKHKYKGWSAGIIASNAKLFHAISLKPSSKTKLNHGGLDSDFQIFKLF